MSPTIFRYALALIISVYIGFGTFHIGQFITADEHYWIYERIPAYFQAWHQKKWKKTLINDKPGISLAVVSGPALLFFEHPNKHCEEQPNKIILCKTEQSEALLRAFRLPLIFTNALLLIALCLTLRRFVSERIALLATILTATSPILLGISQISNPDALLWSTGALTLSSYLAWLKTEERKYLLFASIALGSTLLTKYATLTLLPFSLLALLLFFLFEKDEPNESRLPTHLRKHLLAWFLLPIGAVIMFALFVPITMMRPASIIKTIASGFPNFTLLPITLAGGIFLFVLSDILLNRSRVFCLIKRHWNKHLVWYLSPLPLLLLTCVLIFSRFFLPDWDIFSKIPFDVKDITNARYYTTLPHFWERLILEWNPLIFTLTPLTLIGLCTAWILTTTKRSAAYRFEITLFSLIIFLYILTLIFGNTLATPRYLVLLYPFVAIIAAIGLDHFITHYSQRFPGFPQVTVMFLGCCLLISLHPLLISRPYFLNYANPILPQSSLISDAWGQGGYAAAAYLNSLPQATEITVWSDYYGVCEFFVGKCLTAYNFDRTTVVPQYFILTRRGGIRFLSRTDLWERRSGLQAASYYERNDPEWELQINGKPGNAIRVFKVQ